MISRKSSDAIRIGWAKISVTHAFSRDITHLFPKLTPINGTDAKQIFCRSFKAPGMRMKKLFKQKRIKAAIWLVL